MRRAIRRSALLMILAAPLAAQAGLAPYAAVRLDALLAAGTTVHAGPALEIPAGYYVRTSVGVAGGMTLRDGVRRPSGRVDLISRFLLDPFREVRWGLSLGGGVSVPINERPGPTRPYLAAVVDVEGPPGGAWKPAFQAGLGGGVRLGVVLRQSRPAYR